jgi:carboxylesterase type B
MMIFLFYTGKNVVYVGINYRLNLYGWLKVEDDVPGNWGLLDQNRALRWIQANVAAFGGNPAGITLFGQSAGSMSVSMHVVSPLSSGLFQQAIIQSPLKHNYGLKGP